MKDIKEQFIEYIENLNENQIIYAFTLLKKLFGSH